MAAAAAVLLFIQCAAAAVGLPAGLPAHLSERVAIIIMAVIIIIIGRDGKIVTWPPRSVSVARLGHRYCSEGRPQ